MCAIAMVFNNAKNTLMLAVKREVGEAQIFRMRKAFRLVVIRYTVDILVGIIDKEHAMISDAVNAAAVFVHT